MGSLADGVHAEILARLAGVSVAARQAVEGLLSGAHRSLRRGLSVEFAGHRPYLPGDDLRRLDWQVWARTDRLEIRQYEEETRLRATIVVDASGSLAYGAKGQGIGGASKLDYARTLAAALAFLLVRERDAVGLAVIDTGVRRHLPPQTTMGHLLSMLDALADCPPGGETSLSAAITALMPLLARRGIVILITDALDDPDRIADCLRELRFRRQDVRLIVVEDPDEADFPFHGPLDVRGLEHEPKLDVDADRVRAYYRQAVREHHRRVEEAAHGVGATCDVVSTAEAPADALLRILAAGPAETSGSVRA